MDPRSRYADAERVVTDVDDGHGGTVALAHLVPRTAPAPSGAPPLAWHPVAEGDRVDLLAARYLADPGAYWRIADANDALDPDELTGPEAVGTVVVIPVPGI